MQERSEVIHSSVSLKAKLADYSQLLKFRLTFTVVFSAVIGFLLASPSEVDFIALFALTAGGFLVVGSANGINQIIERNYDKLMLRTHNRPVATNRMSVLEAGVFCAVTGIAGTLILGIFLNKTSAALGLFALVSYAFAYTPLKRISPIAVLVGAFPGAIPPMLGWVAVTGHIDGIAILLFLIQFFWQFPHFWSIAWVLHEDYKRAGYQLLPSNGGRDRRSAFQSILYTLVLIPISILPWQAGLTGWVSALIAGAAGLAFLYQGIALYRSCDTKDAKRLMFFSFIYLPVVLLAYLFDKI